MFLHAYTVNHSTKIHLPHLQLNLDYFIDKLPILSLWNLPDVVVMERISIDQVGCIKNAQYWIVVEEGNIKERWNSMNFLISKVEVWFPLGGSTKAEYLIISNLSWEKGYEGY